MAQLKYCDKHNQVGFLRKPNESAGFAEIVDFLQGSNLRYALTTNPTIYDSLVKQFWQTATANTLVDGTLELQATIDTIEDDDVIHFDNSSNLAHFTSLDDLDFATLNIDGQSMDVNAPPDIIHVDEDNDSIDDEDALPHDLADSDDEDLANDDDNDVVVAVAKERASKNPTGEAGKPTDSIPAGKPGTEFPMHYPSWHKIEAEQKTGSLEKLVQIGMCSLPFCLIPRTLPGVLKMLKTVQRARSYTGGDPAITCCPPRYAESSDTREYPSLIQTYFDTHTVDGVFLRDNERLLYKEILRLQGLGLNTPMGVPYTDDEIMTIVCRGKKRWHLPDVGRLQSQNDVGSGNKSGKGRDDEDAEEDKDKDEDANEDEDADGDAES
ncbi:hypothetical protein Tco_0675070 [Tanacetum coccineum]